MDGTVVRRLEKTETTAADCHSPDDVGIARLLGQKCEQNKPEAQHDEPYAAENAGRIAVRKPTGERGSDCHRTGHGVIKGPVSTCERSITS